MAEQDAETRRVINPVTASDSFISTPVTEDTKDGV
jgi:hypothetical protein